jgi:hypothetical protein
MKTIVVLLLTGLIALTRFGLERSEEVARMPAGVVAPVGTMMKNAARSVRGPIVTPVEPTSKRLDKVARPLVVPASAKLEPLAEPVDVIRVGRRVHVPRDCRTEDGRYDVLVHFHGAPESVIPAFQKADLRAILVIVNLGIGSGPYERGYGQDGSLKTLLERVDAIVDKHCPNTGDDPNRTLSRVGLAGWSAGYGAIYRILGNEGDRELVDAVMLADGLHSGFVNKFTREIKPVQMAAFDRFAELAVRGDKLFAITHTQIVTPTYASTSETANYLVKTHGLKKVVRDEAGPRDGMRLTARADKGLFSVEGYAGGDTDAHCDHLYAIGDTLYSRLAKRWAR